MRSTTSRRSSRADSRNCFAISEVETLSPVLDDMSFLARSRRWRSASLIRTERVCCCFALSGLSDGFPSGFSGLSGNRKLAFSEAHTFRQVVSKHIDRIHVASYDVNPHSIGGRMKLRNAQSDPRKNPDSPRVHGVRLAENSSSESVRESEKPRDRVDPTPSARRDVEVFDLPLTDTRVAIAVRDRAQFLTVQEVASRLGVSRNWVYNHAETLGAYHLGKYLRFSWSRVLECLEK